MKKEIFNTISVILVSGILLSATSCGKNPKTQRNSRKIAEDSPWFNSYIVDVESGSDPDKEIEYSFQKYVGSDDKYIVVCTTGRYKQPSEDEINWNTYNYNDYNFTVIAVIDRETNTVVNTIDLTSGTDKSWINYEHIDTATYVDGIITVKTNSKERDFNPLTGILLDIRDNTNGQYNSNSNYYKVGDYLIDLETHWNYGSSCTLNIIAPNGKTSSIEIEEIDTSITVTSVLAIDDITALLPAITSKGIRIYKLNLTTNALSTENAKDYKWLDVDNLNSSFSGSDGQVYYRAFDGIYRIDVEKEESVKAFDYSWCDINRGTIENLNLADCEGDSFILIGQVEPLSVYSGGQSSFQIVQLTKSRKNPHVGKTVLELYTRYLDENLGEAIKKFNETNEKFYIEIVDVYSGNISEFEASGFGKLNEDEQQRVFLNDESQVCNDIAMDIMSGEGPDILIDTFNFGSLNNPDFLTDLTPFVSDLDSDKYFTNIIKGSKTGDAIYQLPVSFSINGIFTDVDNAGSTGVGFTLNEYNTFVSDTLNGTDLIYYGQAVYFSKLYSSMEDIFIYDGKIDFSKPEFAKLAEYVKNYVPEKCSSPEEIPWEIYNIARYEPSYGIGSFFLKWNNQVNDPTILGIPSLDGRGPMYQTNCSVAISAQATDIEACGAFVKILLSDEIQTDFAMDDCFVINRNSFRNASEIAIDYYNNGGQKCSYGSGVNLINGEPFTQNDIDNVERIVLSCSTVERRDSDLCMILIEEMPAFFSGQKELDAVVTIIQDRAQKVLDERG